MLERDIEEYLVRAVRQIGGSCEKFTSPNRRAVPDRLVLMPGGRIWFVELKAPGKKPTAMQERDHAKRRELGFRVKVIDSVEGVDNFLDEMIHTGV
jgi:hypothetical protein